jgi:hypothetical protein
MEKIVLMEIQFVHCEERTECLRTTTTTTTSIK